MANNWNGTGLQLCDSCPVTILRLLAACPKSVISSILVILALGTVVIGCEFMALAFAHPDRISPVVTALGVAPALLAIIHGLRIKRKPNGNSDNSSSNP